MKTKFQSILIVIALGFLALLPQAEAVGPAPDGCYPGFTTAEGCNALNLLTTGVADTGVGWYSLFSNTGGNYNTGLGAGALALNNADSNTAIGTVALFLNTSGTQNTAVGTGALVYNDSGNDNTAVGFEALFSNTTGPDNTAIGFGALTTNTSGSNNTAVGFEALLSNSMGASNTAIGWNALAGNTTGTSNTAVGINALVANSAGLYNTAIGAGALVLSNADSNTAVGYAALQENTAGFNNTAIGDHALFGNTMGFDNVALGTGAGYLATGSANVYIGAGITGFAGEASHTYIANINTTTVSGGGTDTVTVNLQTGLLGHLSSSRRYKEEIKPMDKASETLYRLKPVTYRFKKEIDSTQSLDYGLVAEEVAEVDSNLAIRDRKGQIESVRYTAINAMLLNEFLKEHRAFIEEQRILAQQQKEIEALKAELKQQRALVQKVSDKVELTQSATKIATRNP